MRAADIKAIAQLMTQATLGITDVVEGVHQAVWSGLGVKTPTPRRTGGITGFVYKSVRGITQVIGSGTEKALAVLQPLFEAVDLDTVEEIPIESPARLAVLSALNGVMGDRLAASQNSLTIEMQIRASPIQKTEPNTPRSKLLLMIHGLCMNDLQWNLANEANPLEPATGLGEQLSEALDSQLAYLRYNTGLHISENGRNLALQLDSYLREKPESIESIDIVAHSMGGLVARSALHYAKELGLSWQKKIKHVIFLGTPHFGAPLEKLGNWVDMILGATPYTAPFAQLAQLRSSGITDLRHGYMLDDNWRGQDRFAKAHLSEHKTSQVMTPTPVISDAYFFSVAACTTATTKPLANQTIGDGLVPLDSAIGPYYKQHYIAYNTNHMQLLHSVDVQAQVVQWLKL